MGNFTFLSQPVTTDRHLGELGLVGILTICQLSVCFPRILSPGSGVKGVSQRVSSWSSETVKEEE